MKQELQNLFLFAALQLIVGYTLEAVAEDG